MPRNMNASLPATASKRLLLGTTLFGVLLGAPGCGSEEVAPQVSASASAEAAFDCSKYSLDNRASAVGNTAGKDIIVINSECTGDPTDPTGAYDRPNQERGKPLARLPQDMLATVDCSWKTGQYIRNDKAQGTTEWLSINPIPGQEFTDMSGASHQTTGNEMWAIPGTHAGFYPSTNAEACTYNVIAIEQPYQQ